MSLFAEASVNSVDCHLFDQDGSISQCVVTPDDANRYAFRPDLIMLAFVDGIISLEEWRMDKDLDEWDRRYPDRLPSKRYNV